MYTKCILLLVAILTVACAKVAVTGRTQLNMIPDNELILLANENYSNFMSIAEKNKAVLTINDSKDADTILKYVNRVSEKIINAAGLQGKLAWSVTIVKANQANAFVLPNGKIVIYTGIFPIAKTEAGLATIISHEVSHVVAKHQAERLSQALMAQLALTAADVALAVSDSKNNRQYRPVIGAALGMGTFYGVLLPFSRMHEEEADHIGLFYMAKAGYDPSEAIALWERMEAARGSGPPQFLSTHPSPSTRMENLKKWLPEAMLYYADQSRPLPNDLIEVKKAVAEQQVVTPIAESPVFTKGYSVTMSINNEPVTFIYTDDQDCKFGNCMVWNSSDGGHRIYDSNYALVEVMEKNKTKLRFYPPFPGYKFPMAVGNTWSENVTIEPSVGKSLNVNVKCNVVGYESVTVPAGTFLCYKIIGTLNGFLYQNRWYSPEAQTDVKVINFGIFAKKNSSIEMLDYKKADFFQTKAQQLNN